MKKILTVLIFTMCLVKGYSQDNDLARRIMEYSDTTATMINNGRHMILEHVEKGDFQEAGKVLDYLKNNVKDSRYLIVHMQEDIELALLAGDWQTALYVARNFKTYYDGKMHFPEDLNLVPVLIDQLKEREVQVLSAINGSNLSKKDQELLKLAYQWSTNNDKMLLRNAERSYSRRYPSSEYEGFLKGLRKASQEWYMGYSLGGGALGFSGNAADVFSSTGLVYFDWDMLLNKFYMGLSFGVGVSGKSRENVTFTNEDKAVTLENGHTVGIGTYGLKVGYLALEDRVFRAYPYLFIGGNSWNVTDDDLGEDPVNITDAFTMGIGGGFDMRLKEWQAHNMYGTLISNEVGFKGALQLDKHLSGNTNFTGGTFSAILSFYWRFSTMR